MGTFQQTAVSPRGSIRRGRGERSLLLASLAGIAAAIALGMATPAHAGSDVGSAEKLRRLDIMLMVTGLRCRTTPDNFQTDYGNFTSKHLGVLNEANRALKDDLALRHGAGGAARALDRMSVVMANEYGNGHPWLSCAELRQVARNLANAQGREPLVEAADQLFSSQPGPVFALASR